LPLTAFRHERFLFDAVADFDFPAFLFRTECKDNEINTLAT
jgi:hypothetical protein